MRISIFSKTSTNEATSTFSLLFWKIIQIIFWSIGIGLLVVLFFFPNIGVTLFWNILIPVAPALLVIGTGVWRNICPLSTTAMLPARFNISKNVQLSFRQQQVLNLVGVITLLLIIPLRHILFNRSGQATGIIIISLAILAIISGFIFKSKSAWCSGLCPIHPVEKLYGSQVAFSLPNAHCNECVKCSVPCPDSTSNITPLALKSGSSKVAEVIMVGAFPGYIWGWFQLPDYSGFNPWYQHLYLAYGYPFIGAAVTMLLYVALKTLFKQNKKLLLTLFSAAAVSCYYWYRLPQLFGLSSLENNSTLIDLSGYLPYWSKDVLNLLSSSFFLWWIVIRNKEKRSWSIRPAYAKIEN